jgi:hypothetical protein
MIMSILIICARPSSCSKRRRPLTNTSDIKNCRGQCQRRCLLRRPATSAEICVGEFTPLMIGQAEPPTNLYRHVLLRRLSLSHVTNTSIGASDVQLCPARGFQGFHLASVRGCVCCDAHTGCPQREAVHFLCVTETLVSLPK